MRLAMVLIAASALLSHTLLLPHAFAKTVTVVMLEEGFLPREVTVEQNDTVTFVNNDKVSRWPASNLHPTHSLYPEFDPKRPLDPKRSWSFTFRKVGVWKYHDHLLPHKRGAITVTSSVSEKRGGVLAYIYHLLKQFTDRLLDRKPTSTLGSTTEPFSAMSQKDQLAVLERMVETKGPEAAWQLVVETYGKRNSGSSNAHDLAHFVGGKIYEKKMLLGLSICSPSFAFGCYHGFTESAFTKGLGDLHAIEKACESVGKTNSGPWASCIHGIGHGIATYFDTINLNQSLNTCEKLINGQTYCFDGVFMEFAVSAPTSIYGSGENPLFPCTSLSEKYKQACARQQPIVMQKFFGMTKKQIIDTCLQAEKTIRFYCIDAIGLTAGQESKGQATAIKRDCALITEPADNAQCVAAAAGELVFQNYPKWQTQVFLACDTLEGTFRASCRKRVEDVIADYYPR